MHLWFTHSPQLGGYRCNYCHNGLYGKTRMVVYQKLIKIRLCLLASIQFTNVIDRKTDRGPDRWTPHDGIGRAMHNVAAQNCIMWKTYDTIQYDSVYFTCSKKLTVRQLSPPHETNKKLKCETKTERMSVMIGPVQSRCHDKHEGLQQPKVGLNSDTQCAVFKPVLLINNCNMINMKYVSSE